MSRYYNVRDRKGRFAKRGRKFPVKSLAIAGALAAGAGTAGFNYPVAAAVGGGVYLAGRAVRNRRR